MKAIVDDKIPYISGKIEQLVDEVVYMPGAAIKPADVRDTDILIVRTRTRCDEQLLAGSRVKLIVTATIGFDHLDTRWLEQQGICWTNCPGCNASSVRQYVHNSLYALGQLKAGMTAGVVGVGHVGSLVADDLEACGMNVLRCDPPKGEPFTLELIAREADIITFHTPLTRDGDYPTYHMADETFFYSLQKKVTLINAARGGVVDEQALLAAMESGQVCHVVIDTWEGEPDINRELLNKAVIATPHVAGYSADGKANATRMSLKAVADYLGIPFTLEVVPPALPDGYSYNGDDSGILSLYDPRTDSERLKADPRAFEWLRGHYPLRREL